MLLVSLSSFFSLNFFMQASSNNTCWLFTRVEKAEGIVNPAANLGSDSVAKDSK